LVGRRLNAGAKANLLWWYHFLQEWNGVSFLLAPTPSVHIYSDASGGTGCVAFVQSLGWFKLQWPPAWLDFNIAVKELLPIVISAGVWGRHWSWGHICFHTDNIAVSALIKSGSSADPLTMHLIRCLCFYAAYFRFSYSAEHIPGILNTAADVLSRNNVSLFYSLSPQTPMCPVPRVLQNLTSKRNINYS